MLRDEAFDIFTEYESCVLTLRRKAYTECCFAIQQSMQHCEDETTLHARVSQFVVSDYVARLDEVLQVVYLDI